MQPLISPIDHESRTSSYRAEDEPRTSEATPLLQRFPRNPGQEEQRYRTTMVVTLLFLVLFAGIVIGTYLLVIQSRSENVLPPVEPSVLMVSRFQWDKTSPIQTTQQSSTKASQVIVVETGTRQCYGASDCAKLLNMMQATNVSSLPYNFMISSDGQTFEALGWRRQSPLFPQYSADALVLAFIGNFTQEAPKQAQILEAKNFLAEALSQERLQPRFVVIGRTVNEFPKSLFLALSNLPQWNKELSDIK
ncbi:unnamed protein product [Parnassius mnemosyne]|uniref:Peptidoglycan recognition protein family domain-containing protein n=1 Tax=Parnassius mnemosyne TaxID=213953 RepID=A0AAV1L127_9NEOP